MTDRCELTLQVEIAARPETVFGFFTRPEDFATWMGAGMGKATIVPEPGGEIRVDFGGPVVVGTVTSLEAPHRFAFTWGYEGDERFPAGSSEVEIALAPTAAGTLLTVRHQGFPDATIRDAHQGGFRLYLSLLAAGTAAVEHRNRLPEVVDAWFAAWNAEDPQERAAALDRCLTVDGEFRDAWAAIKGREALFGHIAASRAFMQGIRLEPEGEPGMCHRYVRFGWKTTGPSGPDLVGREFRRAGRRQQVPSRGGIPERVSEQ